jgi:hypothetical protein
MQPYHIRPLCLVRKYIRLQLPAAIVEPVDFHRLIEIQQFLDVPSIRYETIKVKERK